MNSIAVIGGGGYVGARLIERAVLSDLSDNLRLVPIVRSWRSQGRLARYGVRTARGDASDVASLVPLLRGCAAAVNLTMGDDDKILADVQAIHEACRIAEVPLLVHMSTAEVFGRAEVAGLQEDSIPAPGHWMKYARAKMSAESWLRSQFAGPVKVVILRPGLIWGPGSGWLVQPAQAMVSGTAYLINRGRGVCNLIHVDNLIEHIKQLAAAPSVDSGVYNVADPDTVTWAEFYDAIAREIGVDPSGIAALPDIGFREDPIKRVIAVLGEIAPLKALKKRMTIATKIRIKQTINDRFRPPMREVAAVKSEPVVEKALWWVQGTVNKLPSEAFPNQYPDIKLQSFPDLMTAAGYWLRFAGFGCENSISTRLR